MWKDTDLALGLEMDGGGRTVLGVPPEDFEEFRRLDMVLEKPSRRVRVDSAYEHKRSELAVFPTITQLRDIQHLTKRIIIGFDSASDGIYVSM